MRKYRKMLAAALAAAAVTISAVAVTISAAGAAASAPYTTEYIQVMSDSMASGPASAIARGVFAAAGQADSGGGRTGRLVFPAGTIVLDHKAVAAATTTRGPACPSSAGTEPTGSRPARASMPGSAAAARTG